MVSSDRRKYWIIGGAIVAILLIAFTLISPIKLRYDISSVARIIPAREWLIQRSSDGGLISSVKDHRSGFTENYFAVLVERGDALQFNINRKVLTKHGITHGDTVAYLRSNENERRLAELKGQLKIAKSSLAFYRTGAKETEVNAALSAGELSKEKAGLQERLYERQKVLYEKNLVSKEEIEIARSASIISKLESELAMARLQSTTSGAKPEQLRLVLSEIERYEEEIRVLEERQRQFTFRSSITGRIYKSFAADTLLMAGEEKFLVVLPIPWTERHAVAEGDIVTLENGGKQQGKIIRLNLNTGILNGKQVFTAIAELEEPSQELAPFLFSKCTIEGTELTMSQYMGKYLNKMFSR
ncbi:MAG: hypothetical protein ACRBF0_04075 [Calditrichia bacterium]